MFRIVLWMQNGGLKFYSDELETQSLAQTWVETIFHGQHGMLLHSMEHYDEYLGQWVVV